MTLLSRVSTFLILSVLGTGSLVAQTTRTEVEMGTALALEGDRPLFEPGVQGSSTLLFTPGYLSGTEWGVELDYLRMGLRIPDGLHMAGLGGQFRQGINLGRQADIKVLIGAGAYGGILQSSFDTVLRKGMSSSYGWGGYGETGLSAGLYLSPQWKLAAQGTVRYDAVTQWTVRPSLGLSYDPSGTISKVAVSDTASAPVFPAFQKYFEHQPTVRAVLRNEERFPLENLKIKVENAEWLVDPEWIPLSPLVPGDRRTLLLPVRWTPKILQNTQSLQIPVKVSLSYRTGGEDRTTALVVPVPLFGRNNLIWQPEVQDQDPLMAVISAPDGKASAFIDGEDPNLIVLVTKLKKDWETQSGFDGFSPQVKTLLGIFGFLSERGIRYAPDPNLPVFLDSQRGQGVDFLRFPAETLSLGAGDCDDLTILTASLLEAAGVETALITTPGHLFLAADTGVAPAELESLFTDRTRYILVEGRAWIPVEVTLIGQDFLTAWQKGLGEWTSTEPAHRGFFPVHQAWATFDPPRFPDPPLATAFRTVSVAERYRYDRNRLAETDLAAPTLYYRALAKDPQKVQTALSRLARLNVQYGRIDEAASLLEEALGYGKTYALCMNLGHIELLRNQVLQARIRYQEALSLKDTPEVERALAKAMGSPGGMRLVLTPPTGEVGTSGRAASTEETLVWEEQL